jgi:hypothetical protein
MATVPEHMQDTTSPVVQVVAGLIFAVFLSALLWGLVHYF